MEEEKKNVFLKKKKKKKWNVALTRTPIWNENMSVLFGKRNVHYYCTFELIQIWRNFVAHRFNSLPASGVFFVC